MKCEREASMRRPQVFKERLPRRKRSSSTEGARCERSEHEKPSGFEGVMSGW
nr:hypothetical protein [Methanoculleus marisnigri]